MVTDDELFDLLSKHFSGESVPEENEYIKDWRNRSDENKKEYEIMKKISENIQEAFVPNTEKALQSVMQRLPDQKQPKKSVIPVFLRIAAVLVLALSGSFFGYKLHINNSLKLITYTYNLNNSEKVILSDGTQVWLRENATVTYPRRFIGKTRQVKFEGEGFFVVHHDPDHPFIIQSKNSETEVLGTRFLLRANPVDSINVLIVEEGKVRFSCKEANELLSPTIVLPGQKAISNKKTLGIHLGMNDEMNYQAWRPKQLVFNETKFTNVIRDIENMYNIQFDTVPPNLRDLNVNAIYKGYTLDELLENLQLTMSVTIEKVGGIYHIEPKMGS